MLLLALHLLQFPNESFNTTHDSSSSASFEYYAAKKVQFGTEIYQNVGPYGYVLYSNEYNGYLHWKKVLLRGLSQLTLVILVCWMMLSLKSNIARFFWYAAFFAPYVFSEYADMSECSTYLAIFLMAQWLLIPPDNWNQRLLRFPGWFYLAFISLNKNTFFIAVCGILIILVLQYSFRRNSFQILADLSAFAVSFVINWLLADQHISNIISFISGIFAFSSGYNEAMALPTHPIPLIIGVTIHLAFILWIIHNWWHNRDDFGRTAIGCWIVFLLWKHGFVRSDMHMLIFFYGVLLLSIPFFYYRQHDRPSEYGALPIRSSWVQPCCCIIVYSFCLISHFGFMYIVNSSHVTMTELGTHLSQNASWLFSPLQKTAAMEKQLELAKSVNSLPLIKKTVGQDSIDFFGYEPGYLLLNDLNYTSRPMPITFAAANRFLQEANERFYRDPVKAPGYILLKPGTIDNRFSLQDDALAKRELLRDYRFILNEKELLLFQRKKVGEISPYSDKIIGEQIINFGQTVKINNPGEKALWLEVEIEHTIAGKLLALIYKMPPCYINTGFKNDGIIQTKKFIAGMGNCGFMVNPYLDDVRDIIKLTGTSPGTKPDKQISSIYFSINDNDRIFFRDKIRLRWKSMQ